MTALKHFGIQARLVALGLAVALMGALIVVVTVSSQRKATEARARLNRVESESFRIAERFKDNLREVNDKMRRYASFHEPAVWEEFLKASSELKRWIGEQAPRLTSEHEKAVLQQVDAAYQSYVHQAQDLHSLIEASGKRGSTLVEYNAFSDQARRLMDLGQELGRAHYESRNQLLFDASRTLTQLRWLVLGLVGLLFAFSLALAGVVYRDLIAPLRTKLVESQALAERHEKLASLGLLAAGVAHEVRNPLTAIKTALFIQQKKLAPGSPEEGDARLIEREILRLERIVNEFIQFARPATPQAAILAASEPLEEVRVLLAPQLAVAGIRLASEETDPMRIKVDSSQIQQALINLVQNAADSIGHGGTITLRARRSRQQLGNAPAEVAILEVSDTGKGIPPDVEKRLFDPFFTTKEKGTGLGLAIAARMVEMNGGTLQYQTRIDHGSTFGIVLPICS
jgi:signal transduction histidine kinase